MGEAVLIDKFIDGSKDVLMTRDIIEGIRTVFLDPDILLICNT